MFAKLIGCFVIIAVTGLVGALMRAYVSRDAISWCLLGPVIGYWVARPYFYAKTIEQKEFVDAELEKDWRHPIPREYQLSLPETFAEVRQVFEKAVFNLSDKWKVKADTFQKRITAQLHINEDTGDHRPTRKFLEAEIYFSDTERDSTIVEFHFAERPEGKLLFGLDPLNTYVEETSRAIAERIGTGTVANPELLRKQKLIFKHKIQFRKMPLPSLGLIFISAISFVLFLEIDCASAILENGSTEKKGLTETRSTMTSPEHHTTVTIMERGRQKTFDVTVREGESDRQAVKRLTEKETENYARQCQELKRGLK